MKWFVEKIMRNSHRNLPGRWMPKRDVEEWMKNYHPEPGYSNFLRQEWLKKLEISNFLSPRLKK